MPPRGQMETVLIVTMWGGGGRRYWHMVLEAKPGTLYRTTLQQSRGREVLA